jgi:adenylosuccinate lyase
LREIYQTFSVTDAAAVKKIEAVTNHDVKAVGTTRESKIEP